VGETSSERLNPQRVAFAASVRASHLRVLNWLLKHEQERTV
jgi:hypothetical protein